MRPRPGPTGSAAKPYSGAKYYYPASGTACSWDFQDTGGGVGIPKLVDQLRRPQVGGRHHAS